MSRHDLGKYREQHIIFLLYLSRKWKVNVYHLGGGDK